MYRAFFVVWGIFYVAMAIYTALLSSAAFVGVLEFTVHPGSAQLMAFTTGFIGVLIFACAWIDEPRARVVACVAVIVGQLWNLAAHAYNVAHGYEASIVTTAVIDLAVVLLLALIATRELRGR